MLQLPRCGLVKRMRIIDVTEGSDAWRSWRAGGLGSSDAPVVCGVSRYLDATALWRHKRELPDAIPPTRDNLRLAHGRALEPIARRAVEQRLGVTLRPLCVEQDEHPELRASLDGWAETQLLPVEIKCPGRALHAQALAGRLPRRFAPQALHILLVTGAERLVYASYHPHGMPAQRALALVEVPRDAGLCEQLQRIELEFWRSVIEGAATRAAPLPLAGLVTRRMA